MYSMFKFTKFSMSVEDIINNGREKSTVFNGLEDQVDEFGGGAVNLVHKGAVYLILLAILFAGIGLIWSNTGNRGDAKSKILWIVVGALLIFGSLSLAVLLESVGANLFATTGA